MSDRLKITDDVMSSAHTAIKNARVFLDITSDVSNHAADAVAHDRLGGQLRELADNWRIARGRLVTGMTALEQQVKTVVDTFAGVDEGAASTLRASAAGATGSGSASTPLPPVASSTSGTVSGEGVQATSGGPGVPPAASGASQSPPVTDGSEPGVPAADGGGGAEVPAGEGGTEVLAGEGGNEVPAGEGGVDVPPGGAEPELSPEAETTNELDGRHEAGSGPASKEAASGAAGTAGGAGAAIGASADSSGPRGDEPFPAVPGELSTEPAAHSTHESFVGTEGVERAATTAPADVAEAPSADSPTGPSAAASVGGATLGGMAALGGTTTGAGRNPSNEQRATDEERVRAARLALEAMRRRTSGQEDQ